MPVSDGDILRVVVEYTLPTLVIAQNVYYWRVSDPTPDNPSNSAIVFALEAKLDAMYTDLQSSIANDVEVEDFEVDRIEWDTDHWETVENIGREDLDIVGSNATDAVPHGVALTMTAYTEKPKTRARKFIPGIAEDSIVDSTASGALLTAAAAYMVEWLADQIVVSSAELVPVVVSVAGALAGNEYPLLAAAVNAIAGYQRRRKPGVGA